MKTRDEAIRDMAEQAQQQCEALERKLTSVIDGEDDDGESDYERQCGIGRDKTGRAHLVFSEYGETNRRTVVYVDAILALARLLNGEPEVPG